MSYTDKFNKNIYLIVDGQVCQVMDRDYKTQGRQGGLVRLKLLRLKDNTIIEKTLKAGAKLEKIEPVVNKAIFSYKDDDYFYFMDEETYETFGVDPEIVGDYVNYLKEGAKLTFLVYKGEIINMRRKQSVQLRVVETEPAVKGNTSTGATKPAKVETGYVLQVPLFVKEGDMIRVNTETGQYTKKGVV